MGLRRIVLVLALSGCGSFGADAPAADAGPTEGSAPTTFCGGHADAVLCDDFDTTDGLSKTWTKSVDPACTIEPQSAELRSSPRALRIACTTTDTASGVLQTKARSFGRGFSLSFALLLRTVTVKSMTLLSIRSEGRSFSIIVEAGGAMTVLMDAGQVVQPVALPLAPRGPKVGTWSTIRAEVFYDDATGRVTVDVDDNRAVDASKLFTFPHGQIPQDPELRLGADTINGTGEVDVVIDDVVLERALK